MRLLSNVLLLAALLLAAPRTARAQCPIESFPWSTGAVDLDRAIVSQSGQPTMVARFLAKGPDGWRTTQTIETGDFSLFLASSAAISGPRAIVGCPEATGTEKLSGQAFVFELVGDRWIASELLPSSSRWGDFFGTSVSVSGDVAVVGASHWGPDGIGDRLARAHVFEREGAMWRETSQITTYGAAIAVDGDRIVLGDPDADPGRVHVYDRIGGIWTWTSDVLSFVQPNGPFLGSAVALDGDRLVVGAAAVYQGIPGSVMVFRRVPGMYWEQVQEIVPHARDPYDAFGAAVALSGSTLLVGAPGAHDSNGMVFRFEDDGTRFVERGSIVPEVREFTSFGSVASVHGEDAFLGSYYGSAVLYRIGFESVVPYCPTTPNSTRAHGKLEVEGCDSRSGESITLLASDLPAGVLARCFFGASTAPVPYGDGFRCVGAPIFRLPAGTTSAAGVLASALDFASELGEHVIPGRTCHFQTFHRDRIGSGMNLTNAISVGITP